MWVRRSSAPLELVIQGPGSLRRVGSFDTERELLDFERDLQARLVRTGWLVERIFAHRETATVH